VEKVRKSRDAGRAVLMVIESEEKTDLGADHIVRTWGAAVLRPYTSVNTEAIAIGLTAEILRFARDDNEITERALVEFFTGEVEQRGG
jgi:hypothetical protein